MMGDPQEACEEGPGVGKWEASAQVGEASFLKTES